MLHGPLAGARRLTPPPPSPTPILHATLIARRFAAGWRGVLLRGPSAAGKSELALRALDAGFRLVADDRVAVWVSGGRLFGRPPPVLQGLLEVRYVGLARLATLPFAPVTLVCDLTTDPPERLPAASTTEIAGLALPLFALKASEAGAPARLQAMLEPRRLTR